MKKQSLTQEQIFYKYLGGFVLMPANCKCGAIILSLQHLIRHARQDYKEVVKRS